MNKKPTRRCPTRAAARTFAVGVAVAALVGMVSAGQALALAVPDERVLERQDVIDRHRALGQVDEKGRVAVPPQLSSEDQAAATRADRERRYGRAPTGTPQRFIRPEPPTGRGPQFGDEQVAPSPVRTAPAGARGGLVVIVVVAALLLAVGATTTWRVRHRRPQPESTA
jgi:hypothetical protein